ncbi:MAG: hypothetical protein HS111_08580 [Kofleriaceae bacterium]|nr:hypothetical protein [Kofleriaceae bacterium]MCL4223806.1 hypothetical protein [Myxococcales bacterium]
MSFPRWILPSLAGALAGVTLVVACSDDSPGDADAAVCDCDPAEPPIAGRVMSVTGMTTIAAVMSVTGMTTIAAGSDSAAAGQCPAGAILLGGGCRLGLGVTDSLVHISIAAPSTAIPNSFYCEWRNNSAQNHTGIAEAICLVPPQ